MILLAADYTTTCIIGERHGGTDHYQTICVGMSCEIERFSCCLEQARNSHVCGLRVQDSFNPVTSLFRTCCLYDSRSGGLLVMHAGVQMQSGVLCTCYVATHNTLEALDQKHKPPTSFHEREVE